MFYKNFIFLFLFFPSILFCEQADLIYLRKELQNKTTTASKASSLEILNVSYDPTREFYQEYNQLFIHWWKKQTGQSVNVIQSHGGSGKQARSVISGLKADVVSLGLALDIDTIEIFKGLVGTNWQKRLPNMSVPYFSTIVFLVRKNNPKNIRDWDDLVRKDVNVITPNPKTSGGAKWTYLAAWNFGLKRSHGDVEKTKAYIQKLYANVPVLDTGARGSAATFTQRKMGDVLLAWENEAYLAREKMGPSEYEIIYPSMSIRAEPPVTWIETIIKEKGTEDVSKFYLMYLYSTQAQILIAKNAFRPYDKEVENRYQKKFPFIQMTSIEDFGGWEVVDEIHFKDNGIFDQIYFSGRKT